VESTDVDLTATTAQPRGQPVRDDASRTPWLIVRSSSRPSADTSKGDRATGMTEMNFTERAWYVAFEAHAADIERPRA
jgi:hypothetical protein